MFEFVRLHSTEIPKTLRVFIPPSLKLFLCRFKGGIITSKSLDERFNLVDVCSDYE